MSQYQGVERGSQGREADYRQGSTSKLAILGLANSPVKFIERILECT